MLSLCCCWSGLLAQRFDYYPLYEKGPGPVCQKIAQGPHGFMWIASSDGLIRFDGSREKWYQHIPGDASSLPMNIVNDLTIADNGRVYVRTMWIPLSYLDPYTDTFHEVRDTTFFERTGIETSEEWTEDLLAVGNDSLWFGHRHLMLYHADEERIELIPLPAQLAARNKDHWQIRQIVKDDFDPDYLWIICRGILIHFNQFTHEAEVFETQVGVNGCWGNELFLGVFQVSPETIWLTSWGGGLMRFDRRMNSFHQFLFQEHEINDGSSNIAYTVLQKNRDELWVATQLGLYSFHIEQEEFFFYTPDVYDINPGPMHPTRDLYKDLDDNIWVGSRQGIYKIDRIKNQVTRIAIDNRTFPDLITSPSIAGLNGNQLITGIGTGDGIVVIDMESGERKDYNPVQMHDLKRPTTVVLSALQLRDNTFLFSTTRGLLEFDPHTETLQKWREMPKNNVDRGWDMFEDSRGNIWLSGSGFQCIDPSQNSVLRLGHGPEELKLVDTSWNQGIGEDPQGRIWLSSRFGVNMFDYSTQSVTKYPAKENDWLVVPDITDLVVDQQGYLWVAMRGEGLVRTHSSEPGADVTVYTIADGLLSNTISTLYIDSQNRIYAGGVSGLSILKLDGDSVEVATMDQSDFLMSPSVNHAEIRELSDGRVAIPDELNGILIFDPEIVFKPQISHPGVYIDKVVAIDSVLQGVNAFSNTPQIEIREKDSDMSIYVGHLAFTLPEKIESRYRLSELSEEWRDLSQPVIRYSFLPHGEYELEVQSRYPGQDWGKSTILELKILPAFYQTTWFIVLCILIFLLLLFVGIRRRIATIRREEQLNTQFHTQLAEVEMQALRAQMNPHFLFNCLNSINGFILKNNADAASDYLTKFSRLMRLILQNSKSSMVPIRHELEALQLYVHMESARVNNGFDFELRVAPEVETDFLEVPPLILQPFVENAIWHGIKDLPYGEGKLLVDIEMEEGILRCIVQDNGIGRDASAIIAEKAAKKHKSMGMQITSDRLNLADYLNETHTTVEIEDLSKNGTACGTRVTIHIQLNND